MTDEEREIITLLRSLSPGKLELFKTIIEEIKAKESEATP